jgi:BMFP domain-containing protein YqiC
MDSQPTCGQGLAEHSAVPAKLSELVSAMADNLEAHMRALDLNDENSREEFEVYVKIAQQHRESAGQLRETSELMAGQRGLPMGRHDPTAMAEPSVIAAFQKLVRVEIELVELIQGMLEKHASMH